MKYMNHDDYQRGWMGGQPETKCGYGSKVGVTEFQREWIPAQVKKYGITSIADIGAGDLKWAALTAFGCEYTPYDLIPRAQGVIKFDLLTDKLPEVDCLMVLWLLNHFSPDDQQKAIDILKASGSRYLIMTWDNWMEDCTDLPYLEMAVLRQSTERDLEIRLIEL